jgi:SAM-dependent methyltransferase
MNHNFKNYSKYYNLLYKEKKYSEEVDYVIRLITKYSNNGKNLLELGSGTGIHGNLLNKCGYKVYGIEQSPEMVDLAKSNNFDCEVNDISSFVLNRKFDIVISLFHVISYLTDNNLLIDTFNNANNHLDINGLFIFDVWYSPAVYEQKPSVKIKKINDSNLEVIRIAEPKILYEKNIVDVKFTIIAKDLTNNEFSVFEEIHPMRHFAIQEIDLLAKLTNFEVIKVEEFLTGNNVSISTWGACFILKKINNNK